MALRRVARVATSLWLVWESTALLLQTSAMSGGGDHWQRMHFRAGRSSVGHGPVPLLWSWFCSLVSPELSLLWGSVRTCWVSTLFIFKEAYSSHNLMVERVESMWFGQRTHHDASTLSAQPVLTFLITDLVSQQRNRMGILHNSTIKVQLFSKNLFEGTTWVLHDILCFQFIQGWKGMMVPRMDIKFEFRLGMD